MNEAAFRDEYIFLTYDDILKTHIPTLVAKLIERKDDYKEFIDYSKIENVSKSKILWLSQIRTKYNLLEHIKLKDFDFDLSMMSLTSQIDNVYKDSPELIMVNTCKILLAQTFVKKIYIYTQTKMDHINADIVSMFGNNDKIAIITGDFVQALKSIPDNITMYIVNSVHMADIIMDNAKSQYADILVGEYGYNYRLITKPVRGPILACDGIIDKAEKNHFRLNMFMPIIKDDIISGIENNNRENN